MDKIGTVCSFHYKLSLYITEQNNRHFLIVVSGFNQIHKVKQIVGLRQEILLCLIHILIQFHGWIKVNPEISLTFLLMPTLILIQLKNYLYIFPQGTILEMLVIIILLHIEYNIFILVKYHVSLL